MQPGDLLPERRLALAYAPARSREPWLAMLLLDQRLSRIVTQAREPILAQMRLAWWRDRLCEPPEAFHSGEPLLRSFAGWEATSRGQLAAMVDGWETLLAERPIPAEALWSFAAGRGEACAALAAQLGVHNAAAEVRRFAVGWALAELSHHLPDPAEQAMVRQLIAEHDWAPAQLPREMRPLAVLYGLSRRSRGEAPLLSRWPDGIVAARLGLFGI